ncbi:MAG TPA: class I SAM-dependent methyltransferase [Ktedonobacteraceae bacterium]|nr:class I SAM-dependent methyltransferase [Ktedonobacteraceae bacterium]
MPENTWDSNLYDRKHAFVAEYGKDLITLLDPQPGEHILDVGCGTGHLTNEIARRGAQVVGVDSSPAMIQAAQQNYPTLTFQLADAQDFAFSEPFDALFSNAALHWMNEPERVVQCMAAALKPGGRLVAEFGGKGNMATVIGAVQYAIEEIEGNWVESGWYFPSIGEYACLLEKHGLETRNALLYDRPTRLEEGERGLHNWLTMFGEPILGSLDEDIKLRVIQHVEEQTRSRLFTEGNWYADYRRLRLVAYKVG